MASKHVVVVFPTPPFVSCSLIFVVRRYALGSGGITRVLEEIRLMEEDIGELQAMAIEIEDSTWIMELEKLI